jgi:undecaprenyl-diphosphatase
MEALRELDEKVFLFLNSLHTPWLDPVMVYVSKTIFWIPLYLLLIYLLIKKFKKYAWIPLLSVALVVTLADRITSGFMKTYFMRLRPSQSPELENAVHLVDGYRGGMYGFASSHAANTFGVALFFVLLFRTQYRSVYALFAWALAASYSRIYLGVHYPGDILVGALVGMIAAYLVYAIQHRIVGNKLAH